MWPFDRSRRKESEYLRRRSEEILAEKRRERDEHIPEISEPVRAIAQAMRERPGSFRVGQPRPWGWCMTFWTITDRRTGLCAKAQEFKCLDGVTREIRLPFDLTKDETDFLWAEGEKWLAERQQRTKDYINAKRRREWSRKYGVQQDGPFINREQRGRVDG